MLTTTREFASRRDLLAVCAATIMVLSTSSPAQAPSQRDMQDETARSDEAFRRLAGTWVYNNNPTPEKPRYDDLHYYELTVTGRREFELRWTRNYNRIEDRDNTIRPFEQLIRISADGLHLMGMGSELQNFRGLSCGIQRQTNSFAGSLSEDGEKIILSKTEPEFDFNTCKFTGSNRTWKMTLQRQR
jgi:hypothetical protein